MFSLPVILIGKGYKTVAGGGEIVALMDCTVITLDDKSYSDRAK